jgi:hypothetical protein
MARKSCQPAKDTLDISKHTAKKITALTMAGSQYFIGAAFYSGRWFAMEMTAVALIGDCIGPELGRNHVLPPPQKIKRIQSL